MTTFMNFASRAHLSVRSYRESAEGNLEFVNGHYPFTHIVLKPAVLVESHDEVALAEQAIQKAHEHCLIANSMKTKVDVQETITAIV